MQKAELFAPDPPKNTVETQHAASLLFMVRTRKYSSYFILQPLQGCNIMSNCAILFFDPDGVEEEYNQFPLQLPTPTGSKKKNPHIVSNLCSSVPAGRSPSADGGG
jgi:hypothetical protein